MGLGQIGYSLGVQRTGNHLEGIDEFIEWLVLKYDASILCCH